MNYQTRHLEARQDINIGRDLVRTGERFHASDLDARYYLDRQMVSEVATTATEAAPPQTAKPQGARAGRNSARAAVAAPAPVAPAPAPADLQPPITGGGDLAVDNA